MDLVPFTEAWENPAVSLRVQGNPLFYGVIRSPSRLFVRRKDGTMLGEGDGVVCSYVFDDPVFQGLGDFMQWGIQGRIVCSSS